MIDKYIETSVALKQYLERARHKIDTKYIDFLSVPLRKVTELERKLYGEYTEASCLEAEDSTKRYEEKKYFALMALIMLIVAILAFIFCFGCTCCKAMKMRPKNNFFGHNNGEDRLIINHHWQEESEEQVEEPEQPRYICVRDPNLKDLPRTY